MERALNNALQLVTLLVGIIIGVLIGPRFEHRVDANAIQEQPATGSVSTAPQANPNGSGSQPAVPAPTIVPLQNFMAGPAIAGNVVLAHDLQADHAVVNGYDLLLLDQNIVNYLAELPLANQQMLGNIAVNSRATTLYTLPQRKPSSGPGVPNNGQAPPHQ